MWNEKLNFRCEGAEAPNAETFFSTSENVIVDMDDCSVLKTQLYSVTQWTRNNRPVRHPVAAHQHPL